MVQNAPQEPVSKTERAEKTSSFLAFDLNQ